MLAFNTITHFHLYARIKVLLHFVTFYMSVLRVAYKFIWKILKRNIVSLYKNYQTGYNSYIHLTIESLHFHLTFADSVCKCIKNSCTIFYDFIHELIISLKKKREITYIWKYDNAVTNWIKSRVKLAKHYFSKKIASLQIWNASLHKSILCPTKTFKPRFIWFQYLLSFSN